MKRDFHPVAELFPLMGGNEFDGLVKDVREHGLHEPIWLHQDGRIIDGRNRYLACLEAGVEPRFEPFVGPDDSLAAFVISMNLHRRHLNESQRAMVAARIASMKRGARTDLAPIGGMSQPEAADTLNVGTRSLQRAKQVLDSGCDALVNAVDRGEVAVADAATVAKEAHDKQILYLSKVREGKAASLKVARQLTAIELQREAIESGAVTLPEGVFEVIVIDPPWPYGNAEHYNDKGFRGTIPYPELPMEDLFKLELPAAEDCILWLWTTARFIEEACQLCRTWGFEKKNVLTWNKQEMGVGHWLRQSTELCLFAVKGKPKILRHDVRTLLSARRREHSRKPDEFYKLVESTCIGRRLDFFSRESRAGWAQVGNDPGKFGDAA